MVKRKIGVIVHQPGDNSEELLARFAATLRQRGVNVGGLVQRTQAVANGKPTMILVDLRTGAEFRISQNLGAGSTSCCLDPAGFADASMVLVREIAAGADLLVINKFAGTEAEGRGFAPELFEAIASGIPVLITVAERYRPRWDALTDRAGTPLLAVEKELWRWWSDGGPLAGGSTEVVFSGTPL